MIKRVLKRCWYDIIACLTCFYMALNSMDESDTTFVILYNGLAFMFMFAIGMGVRLAYYEQKLEEAYRTHNARVEDLKP